MLPRRNDDRKHRLFMTSGDRLPISIETNPSPRLMAIQDLMQFITPQWMSVGTTAPGIKPAAFTQA